MHGTWQRILVIVVVSALFLGQGVPVSLASIKMKEVRQQFESEMGKTWDEASAEEKSGFIKKFHPVPEVTEVTPSAEASTEKSEVKKRLIKGKSGDNFIEPKLLFFRRAFKKATKKDWSEATDQERKDYMNAYKEQRRQEAVVAQQQAIAEKMQKEQENLQKVQEVLAEREEKKVAAEQKRIEKQIFTEKRRARKEKMRAVKEKFQGQRQAEAAAIP